MIHLLKNFLLILGITFAFATAGYCQLGKRLTLGVYAGFGKGSGTESFSSSGQPQNVLAGFGAGGLGGANLMYGKAKHFEFGIDVHGVALSKDNYKVNAITVGPQVQFNILPSDKNIIPYVAASVNASFVGLNQSGYSSGGSEPASYSSPGIQVTNITYNNPAQKVGINAALGYKINAGVNFKLNTKLFLFAELGLNSVLLNGNKDIKADFATSKGNFSYTNLAIGIKINLLKSTRLY